MKSQPDLSSSKGSLNGVSKTSRNRDKDVTHEEMQALLTKLKELVPNMPKNKKLSKLEIIQYVIDYIIDLQIALETHPSSRSMISGHLQLPQQNRQPLGVISPLANTVVNTCLTQETSHSTKVPDLGSNTTTRPVSC